MGELYRQFIERSDLNLDKWHDYFPVYERYLGRFLGKSPRVLEIGVQGGGSAILLTDWLGKGTTVTGVDIDPECRKNTIPGLIEIEIGDQADRSFLKNLLDRHGPWDIIIDDGGHTNNQILTSFDLLFPSLNSGGIYLIEDTHAHFYGRDFHDHPQKKSVITLVADLFTAMHAWTGSRKHIPHWRVPPPDRLEKENVPYLSRHVAGIHLFDSMIVIEKNERFEPFCERRVAGQPRETDFRRREAEAVSDFEPATNSGPELSAAEARYKLALLEAEIATIKSTPLWRLVSGASWLKRRMLG